MIKKNLLKDSHDTLNNSSNPFIVETKKIETSSKKLNKNIENTEVNNIKIDNKYNDRPPYNFNREEGKILNKNSIIFLKEDLQDFRNEMDPHNF